MSVVAIIPARGGSKGVPGKNKKLLGGIPLVAHSIMAARSSQFVDYVVVTSDDSDILAIAEEWGAEPILRPDKLSSDEASSEDALLHALKEIENSFDALTVVFLQCTSPFTTGNMIDAVLSRMQMENAQSAFSVVEDHGFIWSSGRDGAAVGVNHNEEEVRKRRQDLEPQYRETGAIYAMDIASFQKEKNRFCGRSIFVPVEGYIFEIDTQADWKLGTAILECEPTLSWNGTVENCKALIMDFDGVLTDDKVTVNEFGEESVVCSRRDGMGIELLRKSGMRMLILSKEKNSVVARRAEKLQLDVIHGVDDKVHLLEKWLKAEGLEWAEIAFVGNDINDKACLDKAGVSIVPIDAHKSVLHDADVVLSEKGGMGAIRELADIMLASRAVS